MKLFKSFIKTVFFFTVMIALTVLLLFVVFLFIEFTGIALGLILFGWVWYCIHVDMSGITQELIESSGREYS